MLRQIPALPALLFLFLSPLSAGPLEDAQALINDKKIGDAQRLLLGHLEINPTDHDLRTLLGYTHAWTKDYSKAEAEFQRVLDVDPRHHDARLGMARLRGYEGRFDKSLDIVVESLALHPESRELKQEKRRLNRILAGELCSNYYRFALRAGYEHEHFSFTGNGWGTGVSLQDRQFYGWNAGAGFWTVRRFGQTDNELFAEGTKALPKNQWELTAGGAIADRHILYPKYRLLTGVGKFVRPLHLSLKSQFKNFDAADVWEIRGAAAATVRFLSMDASYTLSWTNFPSADSANGLPSIALRLGWLQWCRVQPWISAARTKEAFEAGRGGTGEIRAYHAGAGVSLKIRKNLDWRISYSREDRINPDQHVVRIGTGLTYSLNPSAP